MKIKDTDYLYATMRVRANENSLLSAQAAERMIEAKTPEEAAKVLADVGYRDASARSFSEIEKVLKEKRLETFALIDEICENKHILEVFALKYDFHNIKTVIKAALTGQDPEPLFADGATVDPAKLLAAYRADELSELPAEMESAIKEAREALSHTGDAQYADFVLDRAYFDMLKKSARESGSEFLVGYVALLSDIANLRSAVRTYRRGKDAAILRDCLVGGGSIAEGVFLSYDFESGFSSTSLADAAEYAKETAEGKRGFLEFERELDNILIKYMKSAKYIAYGEKPIVAYIAARENEAMMIRIIMAGKLEGLAPDEIRSRLRVF